MSAELRNKRRNIVARLNGVLMEDTASRRNDRGRQIVLEIKKEEKDRREED